MVDVSIGFQGEWNVQIGRGGLKQKIKPFYLFFSSRKWLEKLWGHRSRWEQWDHAWHTPWHPACLAVHVWTGELCLYPCQPPGSITENIGSLFLLAHKDNTFNWWIYGIQM